MLNFTSFIKEDMQPALKAPVTKTPKVSLHDSLKSHYSNFDNTDKEHIKTYTNSSWRINGTLLRGKTGVEHPDHDDKVKGIDHLLSKHAAPHDMHVYTGVDDNHPLHDIESKHKEHNLIHPGYTSTSISKSRAEGFAKSTNTDKHVLKIHVPAGHPGAYIDHLSANKGEKEFLLPRGTKLKVHPNPEVHHDLYGDKIHTWNASIHKDMSN
jgi:hypothetical protein